MSDLFNNKYRIPSARLKGWDYRQNAMYFITICTKEREHFFGEISNEGMIFSETGKLCEKYLNEIPAHFPFVLLDESVVMPNHLHAIVVIDVETLHATSLPALHATPVHATPVHSSISPKSGSLSTILRSFKAAVTKDAKSFARDFGWQTRFHDHIIRDEDSYWRIKKYIQTNVQNWKDDRFYGSS